MGDMPLKLRPSKFRHVYGQSTRKESCYENIRITKNAHDSNFCAINPRFMAVVLESVGGGAFLVLPLKEIGRVDINAPKVCGHAGPITDIKWNPFDDYVIASSSDDMTIKLWEIPELGLHSNISKPLVDLKGHTRRVTYIEWHPSAENILLSCGFDYKCIVWNVGVGLPLNVISCHKNTIYSLSWNPDGSLFATTCKDRKIRIINPRTGRVVQEGTSHYGLKACKVVFLTNNRLFTTGFSKTGDREIALWNSKSLCEPLYQDTVDYSSGVLLPYYDSDLDIIYLAGKGDGNIRYFEVTDDSLIYLNQYPSSDPQRSMGFMPKRGLDVSACEIARFYKLHTNKQLIEPIPMIVPRRSEEFQEDIYPATDSIIPAMSADEWASGTDKPPLKESLQDIPDRSDSGRVGTLRQHVKSMQKTQVVKPVQNVLPPPKNAPASLQNIYKLSTDASRVTVKSVQQQQFQQQPHHQLSPHVHTMQQQITEHSPSPPPVNLLPSQVKAEVQLMQQQQHQQYNRQQLPGTARVAAHVRPAQRHPQQYTIHQGFYMPNTLRNEDDQRIFRESPTKEWRDSGSPRKDMSPGIPPWESHSSSQHNVYTSHHIHQQSTPEYSTRSDMNAQRTQQQQMKWRNNAAWQKPAAPVGTPPESLAGRVIGHHQGLHNRQPKVELKIDYMESAHSDNPLPLILPEPPVISPHSPHESSSPSLPFHHNSHDSTSNLLKPALPIREHKSLSPSMYGDAGESTRQQKKTMDDSPVVYNYSQIQLGSSANLNSQFKPGITGSKAPSEVERKKKLKSQKQKIKRSSSASKVEDMKQPVVPKPEPRTPPERESSIESLDDQRKQYIIDKVAELKRIRDLAKAYADGTPVCGITPPQALENQRLRDDDKTCWSEPPEPNSDKKARVAPHIISSFTPPPQRRRKQQQQQQRQLPLSGDRYAYPNLEKSNESQAKSSPLLKKRQNVVSYPPAQRNSTGSRYDNCSSDEEPRLPKFPVQDVEALSKQVKDVVAECSGDKDQESKVSAPVVPQVQHKQAVTNGTDVLSNDELHKAYFKQCEEMKQMRQLLVAKDKRIETLETELAQLKKMIISL